jgi:hypothetical protein
MFRADEGEDIDQWPSLGLPFIPQLISNQCGVARDIIPVVNVIGITVQYATYLVGDHLKGFRLGRAKFSPVLRVTHDRLEALGCASMASIIAVSLAAFS